MYKNEHKFPYRWTKKDANFTKDKGKVMSCFCCGGGSSFGYKLAGYDVVACNEIDPKVMKMYLKNHDIDISDYINDLYRILKDRSHCYLMCNDYNLMHFLDVVGKSEFHFTKCLIWDKCAKICGRYYMAQKEYIIMLRKGGDRPINECGTSDILSVPIPTNKRKDKDGLINQTEKPVKLMEILIRNSTNVDDVVLDPFMGSGTTARACVNLERKYIGFEIDQRQVDFANNELKNMSRQLSLF